jgi:hypothetical protein
MSLIPQTRIVSSGGRPAGQAFARTLSSLQDVIATDLDGDYGRFTGSLGATVLRLKRGIALPSGAVDLWLPPTVYAGTITMRAHFTGLEDDTGLDATLAGKGWTVTKTAVTGIVSTALAAGFVRLSDGGVAATQANLSVTAFASGGLAAGTKWYMQASVRLPTCAFLSTAVPSVRDGASIWNLEVASAGAILASNSLASTVLRSGGVAMPTSGTPTVLQIMDEGSTVGTVVTRDGGTYFANRRNATSLVTGSNFFVGDISTALAGMTQDWQHCYVLTWV